MKQLKLWRKLFPTNVCFLMWSVKWSCKQTNKKTFFGKISFVGIFCVYNRGHLFYFCSYKLILVISWFWRNSYSGAFCFGHPPVFWYFSAISYYLFLRDGQTLNRFSNYYYLGCVPGLLMCVLLCSPQLHAFVLMLSWSLSKLFMSSPHRFMYKDTKNSVSVKWKLNESFEYNKVWSLKINFATSEKCDGKVFLYTVIYGMLNFSDDM